MDRILISPLIKNGKHEVTVNPDFIYLDTSAWIDMFGAYVKYKEKTIERIARAIGNHDFRTLISVVNFFELIGTGGDISKNFSAEYLNAISNIRMTSAHQPKIIIDQEVLRFIDKDEQEVRILDANQVALNHMIEGFEQRQKGNDAWFREKRIFWDEMNIRDRTLDLEADMNELSGIMGYPSFSSLVMSRDHTLSVDIQAVTERKSELANNKVRYKGKKEIPSEEEELLKYARHRLEFSIAEKYGHAEVSMIISNPRFIFPGRDNIIADLISGSQLTFSKLKEQLPGLYWSAKITYYNYYHGPQRAGGQFGDRNHAVYIPYSNYFATSDQMIVNALKSEYTSIFAVDNLHLFKIT